MAVARRITLLLGCLWLSHVSAAVELTPHTAQYKVKISVLSGQLDTELRQTGNTFVANHVIRPTGLSRLITRGTMDVTSEFASAPDGIRPIRFQSTDTIRSDPDIDLRFDWTTNEATGTVGEEDVALQLEGIAYDNVSIQYALMHDLLNGGPKDRYVLFDIGKMRIADVSIAGEKEIETKAGKFGTIGIRHQKEASSRVTTLWCAKELGYLPVVIEQHKKGKLKFRAKLVQYTPGAPTNPE